MQSIEESIIKHVEYTLARSRYQFDDLEAYQATAYSLRDRLILLWNDTQQYFKWAWPTSWLSCSPLPRFIHASTAFFPCHTIDIWYSKQIQRHMLESKSKMSIQNEVQCLGFRGQRFTLHIQGQGSQAGLLHVHGVSDGPFFDQCCQQHWSHWPSKTSYAITILLCLPF